MTSLATQLPGYTWKRDGRGRTLDCMETAVLDPPIACNVGSTDAHASTQTTGLCFEITTELAVQIVDIPPISAMGLRYVLGPHMQLMRAGPRSSCRKIGSLNSSTAFGADQACQATCFQWTWLA